ncbi:MAG: arylamine N-acetyltransferase [Nevskiaceae bacterium]|nr:MAG: arylamine N-acetyltransferase [Nevskiaceae bacterium]TBR75089.1 MAG: arylamine N-acetyltransferase [Nevskiaceae bacterium]
MIDLDAYFRRIAYTGSREPTVAVLHALTAAHSRAIPFENLDVLLQRPIQLTPEALFRKLVEARRGGYCFEQNGLFMEVLAQLGFDVQPLSARVRLGLTDRGVVAPRTHMFLRVHIAGESWLTDVGVGSASLTGALRWQEGDEQPTPHEARRFVRANERWYHQIRYGDRWADVYEFTGEEMPFIDRVIANWYVSAYPGSHFRNRLVVARALPEGRRVAIANDELILREADGTARSGKLVGNEALLTVLDRHFGIRLAAGTRIRWNVPAGCS